MKWVKKGREYSNNEIVRLIDLDAGIYIFGTGEMARNHCEPLWHFNLVRGVIDNDERRQGKLYHQMEILSFNAFLKRRKNEIIIIAANKKNAAQIRRQLNEAELQAGKDFFLVEEFMTRYFPILLSEQYNKNYVELVQISLTERCSLKCQKCAHGCHMVPMDSMDMTIDEAKTSADYFFSFTDYVKYFVLIGGEPLLYRDLDEIISYIAMQYGDKIEQLQITTNGTIVPNDRVLRTCKNCNVFFMISNYTKQVPRIVPQVQHLCDVLNKENIDYALFPEETEWTDYGFDYLNREASEKELIRVFDACKTGCHEIRKEKFYYCVMARSVSENMMGGHIGKEDYLDLQLLKSDNDKDRKIFFEYTQGYSDNGYLKMCNYCHGAERIDYPIPAAVQAKQQ